MYYGDESEDLRIAALLARVQSARARLREEIARAQDIRRAMDLRANLVAAPPPLPWIDCEADD